MNSYGDWEKSLPSSTMIYPSSIQDRLKYHLWKLYTPFHPRVRDLALTLKIVSHSGRQNYLIGKISPGQTIKNIVDLFIAHGYGNHFIAWKDEGELVSLRRVVDFKYQYHIRIFADGEIRGHYEYTPECYPFLHLKAVDQIDRREEFLRILRGKII